MRRRRNLDGDVKITELKFNILLMIEINNLKTDILENKFFSKILVKFKYILVKSDAHGFRCV